MKFNSPSQRLLVIMSRKFVAALICCCLSSAILACAQQSAENSTTTDGELVRKFEKPLFNYNKNGIKIDMKIVPVQNKTAVKNYFPTMPVRDITNCLFDFSLVCVQKRIALYLEAIGRLHEIYLLGQNVKLVRVKSPITRAERRLIIGDLDARVQRSFEDLFDSFALRITLPRWNRKLERNQIDIALDDNYVEGLNFKEFFTNSFSKYHKRSKSSPSNI